MTTNTTPRWKRNPDFEIYPIDQVRECVVPGTEALFVLLLGEDTLVVRDSSDVLLDVEYLRRLLALHGELAPDRVAIMRYLPISIAVDKTATLVGRKIDENKVVEDLKPRFRISQGILKLSNQTAC